MASGLGRQDGPWTDERMIERSWRVVGESDSRGALPKANPKSPQDVLATIYRHLGIDEKVRYLDGAGRPIPVLTFGPIDS